MAKSAEADASAPGPAIQFVCPRCQGKVQVTRLGQPKKCPSCRERLGPVAQMAQLLARWYEPRRWRADLVRPSVPFVVERLWTAGGQGERLYQGVAPHHANYDVFRNLVTGAVIRGIDEGWAELRFPADPLVEDPRYELHVVDSERFARAVEALFPEVDWNEPVTVPDVSTPDPRATG